MSSTSQVRGPVAAESDGGTRLRALVTRLDLLASAPISGLEAALAAVYLFGLAFAVFGVHVVRGSFMFDDWTLAYDVRQALDTHGFFGAVNELLKGDVLTGNVDGRPTEAVHLVLQYALFGEHTSAHIASAVLLAALVSFLFYVMLRWLGLERLHAGAIATLVLLFPAKDSTVFFLTADVANVTLALYLAGTLCALRGLRARDGRAAALHALALGLYVASILEYQIAAPFILLSFLVYRVAGAPWRTAIGRWGADVIVTVISLAYVKEHLDRPSGSLSDDVEHARQLAGGASRLLSLVGVQGGPSLLPTIVLVALLLVATSAALFLPHRDVVRGQLRRWLVIVMVGLTMIGAAYTIFIPADFFYWPLREGVGNRVNAAAALGYAIVIYGLTVIVAFLVVRAMHVKRITGVATGIAAAATVVLTAYYIAAVNSDRQPYERSANLQREAFAVLRHDVPRPAPGTIVYLFGIEGEVAPNVFTFVRWQDITAALRLTLDDDTLEAVPASSTAPDWPGNTAANSGISCGRDDLKPNGWLFDDYPPSRYGEVLFVDIPTRSYRAIRSRSDCEDALARYQAPA